jgi:hypothetical protein
MLAIHEVARCEGRFRGIGAMAGAAALAEPDLGRGDEDDEAEEHRRHTGIHVREDDDGPEQVDERGDDPPHEGIDQGPEIARRCGYPLSQRAGEILGEVAHRLTAEAVKEFKAQVDPNAHGGLAGQPPRQTVEDRFRRNESEKERQR